MNTDQMKIGKYISEKRKLKGLTQMQLAEKLGISDRAVSKWETGKSLPDASIMLELCRLLNITVNDLLSGEDVSVEKFNDTTQKNLLEMIKQKEAADKRLLKAEIVIVIISLLFLFAALFIFEFTSLPNLARVLILLFGFAVLLAGCFFALKIEQVAGFYECKKCGNRYVPTYISVNLAPHIGRTRYMKCPKCRKKSWQKKVIVEK